MRHLIAIILGSVVAACSPSPSPIASVPSSQAPTEPPINAPSTTPASDETSVDLADVESQPIATRAPSSGCTADDWAGPNLDRTMTLADQPISFQFQTASPRDGSAGGWSDGVPPPPIRFDAHDTHQTVEAMAGSVTRLEPAPTITLTEGTLDLYRLDANDHAGDGLPVATTDLGGDVNALDVPLPTQAGRWLLSAYAHWQTGCASGDGYVDLLLITT
jgi:hypothetical protein